MATYTEQSPRPHAWSRLAVLVASVLALWSARSPQSSAVGVPQSQRVRLARVTTVTRGGPAKLAPDLQRLYRYWAGAKGARHPYDLPESGLAHRYGIAQSDRNPEIEVIIRIDLKENLQSVQTAGARVRFRAGDLVYASIPVLRLEEVARLDVVRMVNSVPAGSLPQPPEILEAPRVLSQTVSRGSRGGKPIQEFNRQGLTGKGVVVVLVDSGIDWRHPDFIRPDGKTRILALWDMGDNSWATSHGRIGSRPPYAMTDGAPIGTLYTQQQLNAALAGKGTVNSRDRVGHGTACAGVAAGNGRATANGVPPGAYRGVASEADLVVVNASDPAVEGAISGRWPLGTLWGIQYAAARHEPCVVNQSFGNNYTAKDGTDRSEQMLDRISGPGKPGVVICTAAGNEGRYSFHAGGRFGPSRPGQGDVRSAPIDLLVTRETWLTAYFSRKDDWGVAIVGLDRFLVDEEGQPMEARFFHAQGRLTGELWGRPDAKPKEPSDFRHYFEQAVSEEKINETTDRLEVVLPPGRYLLGGYGASAKVTDGRLDLILPDPQSGSFGRGTQRETLISSPGNAGRTLTIGAYNFRAAWVNLQGKETRFNLRPGELAEYSSPGFRRDGFVKPDVMAPATYAISSLAADSAMGKDRNGEPDAAFITRDGRHLAWAGTSAATPYVVGVVALMLQKNPSLDAAQVKAILTRSASGDRFTGKLPNPKWGHGKINPAAALKATPRRGTAPGKKSASRLGLTGGI